MKGGRPTLRHKSYESTQLRGFPPSSVLNQFDSISFAGQPFRTLTQLDELPNLQELNLDRTSLSTFQGAKAQPSLKKISFRNTALITQRYVNEMCLIVFGDSLTSINGVKPTAAERTFANENRGKLRAKLVEGWIITRLSPLKLANMEQQERLTEFTSDPLKKERTPPSISRKKPQKEYRLEAKQTPESKVTPKQVKTPLSKPQSIDVEIVDGATEEELEAIAVKKRRERIERQKKEAEAKKRQEKFLKKQQEEYLQKYQKQLDIFHSELDDVNGKIEAVISIDEANELLSTAKGLKQQIPHFSKLFEKIQNQKGLKTPEDLDADDDQVMSLIRQKRHEIRVVLEKQARIETEVSNEIKKFSGDSIDTHHFLVEELKKLESVGLGDDSEIYRSIEKQLQQNDATLIGEYKSIISSLEQKLQAVRSKVKLLNKTRKENKALCSAIISEAKSIMKRFKQIDKFDMSLTKLKIEHDDPSKFKNSVIHFHDKIENYLSKLNAQADEEVKQYEHQLRAQTKALKAQQTKFEGSFTEKKNSIKESVRALEEIQKQLKMMQTQYSDFSEEGLSVTDPSTLANALKKHTEILSSTITSVDNEEIEKYNSLITELLSPRLKFKALTKETITFEETAARLQNLKEEMEASSFEQAEIIYNELVEFKLDQKVKIQLEKAKNAHEVTKKTIDNAIIECKQEIAKYNQNLAIVREEIDNLPGNVHEQIEKAQSNLDKLNNELQNDKMDDAERQELISLYQAKINELNHQQKEKEEQFNQEIYRQKEELAQLFSDIGAIDDHDELKKRQEEIEDKKKYLQQRIEEGQKECINTSQGMKLVSEFDQKCQQIETLLEQRNEEFEEKCKEEEATTQAMLQSIPDEPKLLKELIQRAKDQQEKAASLSTGFDDERVAKIVSQYDEVLHQANEKFQKKVEDYNSACEVHELQVQDMMKVVNTDPKGLVEKREKAKRICEEIKLFIIQNEGIESNRA